MRFGIQHGMGDPRWVPEILRPSAVTSFARTVDQAGYSHLAFTDHPAPSARWVAADGEGVAELFTALGFCAAVTERVRLLTWMLVLPYHNPFTMAHRIATLDALSGGRLTLGVGTGYLKSEFHAVGADFDDRRGAFDRHLAVIREALGGTDVSAEGPGYSAREVQVQPPGVQHPHPPVWVHGNGRFGTERAARLGEGWVGLFTRGANVGTIRTTPLPDIETFARRVAELRIATEQAGRSIDEVTIIATGVVPAVDPRVGWNIDEYADTFGRLGELGVETIVVNACGDDPSASEAGAAAFAADFITTPGG